MIAKDDVLERMEARRITKRNEDVLAETAAFEREQSKARVSKAEDKAVYYDIAEDLNTTDAERMPTRRVLGDISVLKPKVEFMPPQTRTYATAGDVVVPVDEWMRGELQESQPPTQRYICENPAHTKPADAENFLAPGEGETVRPADFVAPKPAVLKRAAGLFSNIINSQDGDGVAAADRFLGGK